MKKLLPIALGAALLVTAGTALAQSASSTQEPAAIQTRVEQGWHWRGGLFHNEELLSLLKMDAQTLRQQWMSGKSLAEIAAEKGISAQQLIDLLLKAETQKIDEAVKAGKLTQTQADQLKSSLEKRIQNKIEQKGDFKGKAARFHKGKLDEAASVLGLSVDELLAELKSGKSIAQIAEEKGISKQQLIDSLLEKEKERITQWVEQPWKEKPAETQQNTEDSSL